MLEGALKRNIQRRYVVPDDHTTRNPCGCEILLEDFQDALTIAGKEEGIVYRDYIDTELVGEGWAKKPSGKVAEYYARKERYRGLK